jgi:hypothetical protein
MLQVNGNVTTQPLDEHGPLLGPPEQVAADLDQGSRLGVGHVYWNSDDDPLSQLPLLEQRRRSLSVMRLPEADACRLISTPSRLRLPANTVVATALALRRRASKPLLIARQTLGESGRREER